MKTKLHFVLSLAIFLIVFSASGQNSSLKKIASNKNAGIISKLHLEKSSIDMFELNMRSLKQNIATAKLRTLKNTSGETTISLPTKTGSFESFRIYEAPVFSPSLAKKYPNIKSFVGIGIDNPKARLRMSVSHLGIETMVTYLDKPTLYMQPISKGSNQYILYDEKDKTLHAPSFDCGTLDVINTSLNKTSSIKVNEGGANNQTLQKFRIAISTTAEYTAYHYVSDSIADALAAINATLSRVNEIFETDMAATFELVDATQLIYTDATTDPYSDANIGTDTNNADNTDGWNLQLQNTLSQELGATINDANAAYDIGHLFGATGGGGNAGCIGCVCDNDTASTMDKNKGSGYTSPADGIPEGDTFDINYVVHEIGHQMGANHTFAYSSGEQTGVNSEPGSGTTIMAYAGVADPAQNNIQTNSDAYFHYQSIKQILNNLNTKSCQIFTPISNNPPIANAGSNYKIPAGTPYILKGSATDSDSGDVLTYCWEETDSGLVNYTNFGPTLTSGPMNRSLPPTTSPNRYIPRLSSVLNGDIEQTNPGLGSDWETVANVHRFLNWALTVRDRNTSNPSGGQSSYDTMQIEVLAGTVGQPVGPFEVTSQATSGISWVQGNTETITWNVANTNDVAGINTQFVNILLSTDDGVNFDTILKSNTPNDGTENITVPNMAAPFCRIMIEPVGNIYYAVNPVDFAIGYTVTTTCSQQFPSNSNLNLSIPDGTGVNQSGSTLTNTINIPAGGAINDIKVNVDVSHTYIGDLIVTLTHPNGITSVNLWERNCNSDPSNTDFDIIFQDGANSIFCDNPTVGTYRPASSLSAFDGLDVSGTWTLSITDNYIGDTGTLNDWYMEFCTTTATLNNPESMEFQTLNVFPNPNKGSFTVSLNEVGSQTIDIHAFDLRGRLISKKSYNNKTNHFYETIDLNNVQPGMYLLNVSDGIRQSTKKIIIE